MVDDLNDSPFARALRTSSSVNGIASWPRAVRNAILRTFVHCLARSHVNNRVTEVARARKRIQ
jgi:hypothetical protein